MPYKEELEDTRHKMAVIADNIEGAIENDDIFIEYEEWRQLAEAAKNSLSKLLDKMDDEIANAADEKESEE